MLVRILACGICGSDLHFLRHGETMVSMTDADAAVHGRARHGDGAASTCRATSSWATSSVPRSSSSGPTPPAPRPALVWCRSRCCSRRPGLHQLAYNNAYPGRLRPVHGVVGPARPRGPQRARLPARRADRAAGGGHPRRGPLGGDGRATAPSWWDAGRSGLAVIAGAAGRRRRVDRGRRPLPDAPGHGAHHGGDRGRRPDRGGRGRRLAPARRAPSPGGLRGGGGAGHAPAAAARRAPRDPRSRSSGCAWSPTGSCPSSPSPRSCRCTSPWPTAPTSSPARCGPWPRGTSTCRPMITGTVDLDGVPGAFEALARPDEHVKILVEPGADVTPPASGRSLASARLAVAEVRRRAGPGRPGPVGAGRSHRRALGGVELSRPPPLVVAGPRRRGRGGFARGLRPDPEAPARSRAASRCRPAGSRP